MDSISDSFFSDALLFDNPFDSNSPQPNSNPDGLYNYDIQLSMGGYVFDCASSKPGNLMSAGPIDPHIDFAQSGILNGDLYEDSFAPQAHCCEVSSTPTSNSTSPDSDKETPRRISGETSMTDSKPEHDSTVLPKKRRNRKRKPEPTPAEEAAKRQKFLERNRVAAGKCRQKNRKRVGDIQAKLAALETENAILQLELRNTRDEVDGLRKLVMMHEDEDGCNHENLSCQIKKTEMQTHLHSGRDAGLLSRSPALVPCRPASAGGGIDLTRESPMPLLINTDFWERRTNLDVSSSGKLSCGSDKKSSTTTTEFQSPTDSGIDMCSPKGDKTHRKEESEGLVTVWKNEELVPDFRTFIRFDADHQTSGGPVIW
jgi:hypothetical protein